MRCRLRRHSQMRPHFPFRNRGGERSVGWKIRSDGTIGLVYGVHRGRRKKNDDNKVSEKWKPIRGEVKYKNGSSTFRTNQDRRFSLQQERGLSMHYHYCYINYTSIESNTRFDTCVCVCVYAMSKKKVPIPNKMTVIHVMKSSDQMNGWTKVERLQRNKMTETE